MVSLVMKINTVRSSWFEGYGYRLDCQPYLSGALETKTILETLPVPKHTLRTVTAGYDGGIYNGPKFRRTYVDGPEYGVPFAGSSSMLYSDLSNLPYLSKEIAYSKKLSHLELKPGMTLISCSGTIGKTVYSRPEMDGIWSSQHIMKVVPDPDKVPPGYLYAYLSSKFGVPLLVSGTYGSIIQSIEPEHIAALPVPRLGREFEEHIDSLVKEAGRLRSEANEELRGTSSNLVEFLQLSPLKSENVSDCGWESVRAKSLQYRLDAHFHSKAAIEAETAIRNGRYGYKQLSNVSQRLFKPPIFKRLFVEDPSFGTQFISGNDAYKFRSDDIRYVSKMTPRHDEFILHRGWVVFQAAGQIYGLFGRPLYVRGWLEELFCADDVYRIVPRTEEDGAFLYAYFRTAYGRISFQRQSAGDSIPRVWDPQVSQIIVPWPDRDLRYQFAARVIKAHEAIEEARQKEDQAIANLEAVIDNLGKK